MDDLNYWLLLHHCPGITGLKIQSIFELVGSGREAGVAKESITAKGIVEAGKEQWIRWGLPPKAINYLSKQPTEQLDVDLNWLDSQEQRHILSYNDKYYPALLQQISDPPLVLYVQGNKKLLPQPQIAIVGSRNPTAQGSSNARQFSSALAQSDVLITSGLALGIDGQAHLGALDKNKPTIAVMGTGLDRIYPARHQQLAHQICENGALISEFSIGVGIRAHHFPKRNRIISGMSLGVLVIEAAIQSGSLITAKLAVEQGREVFALPGSIHNPLAKGCHKLIQEGAKLVETSNDILEELSALALYNDNHMPLADENVKPEIIHPLDDIQAQVLDAISFEPTSLDSIIERSRLSVEQVSSATLMLELAGLVVSEVGGFSRYC